MKTISIRELHEKTGQWIRSAGRHGGILVTDHGQNVARIVPQTSQPKQPYFARRRLSAGFKKMSADGKWRGGTDVTRSISEEREDRDL